MQRQYEFAILGPGALGSIVGGHLARAGHSVAMLARGRRAALLSTNGVVLTGLAELSTPVDIVTDPAALRSADVLIVATKTPGTDEALARLRHFSAINTIAGNHRFVDRARRFGLYNRRLFMGLRHRA